MDSALETKADKYRAVMLCVRTIETSSLFHRIMAYLLDQDDYTEDLRESGIIPFNDMTVTSDGFLLAQEEGDCGFNHFISGVSSLWDNINGIAALFEQSQEELILEVLTSAAFDKGLRAYV